MAKKVTISLVDDIDKSDAAETVSFSLDGVNYEIDLSSDNAGKLRDAMALYIARAERVGGRKSTRSAGGGNGRSNDKAAVREWARSAGHQVSERGRIPADVQAAYDKAHS